MAEKRTLRDMAEDIYNCLPENKSIILGIADREGADIIMMHGDPEPILRVIQLCLDDINKKMNEEYLN